MFKSFLPSLKGIKHERVRYSVACSTSSTISEGLNEYFKIKKLHLFAFSRNACFHQRPLKQFWVKRNHSQVDRVDTSSSASSLKTTFLLYEKSFIRCKMQILLLVFGRVEKSCLKAWQLFSYPEENIISSRVISSLWNREEQFEEVARLLDFFRISSFYWIFINCLFLFFWKQKSF